MKANNILQGIEYNEKKPEITVLFETDFTKEIRIAMHKDNVMKEHKTSFPIIVHVIDGNIEFGVNLQVKNLIKGDLIALEANVPHDLKALENSIIRLTLTKQDNSERVSKVING